MSRAILAGYDRKSLAAIVLLVVSGLALGRGWDDLFGSGKPDWLLIVMWAWLAVVLPWRVSPGRDVLLLVIGFGGGALIETWGTWTGVWWYFTAERPPWWVIPAWSTTALAGERTANLIELLAGKLAGTRIGRMPKYMYWVVLPGFAIAMTRFSWPAASGRAVAVAAVTMAVVIASTRRPAHDLAAFAAGSLLGVFIEPWGTGHRVWTYYTLEVPPVEAVLAHGFATVAFLRATGWVQLAWEAWRGRRWAVAAADEG